jgi:hypothetical protein
VASPPHLARHLKVSTLKPTTTLLRAALLLGLCALLMAACASWALQRGRVDAQAPLLDFLAHELELARLGSVEAGLEYALTHALQYGFVATSSNAAAPSEAVLAQVQSRSDALAALVRVSAPAALTPEHGRLHRELAQRRQALLSAGVAPAMAALRDTPDSLPRTELLAKVRALFARVHEAVAALREHQRELAQRQYMARVAEQSSARTLRLGAYVAGSVAAAAALTLALRGMSRRRGHGAGVPGSAASTAEIGSPARAHASRNTRTDAGR